MTGATDWGVLGIDPVPADPGGLDALAEAMQARARIAMGVAQSLQGLAAGVSTSWTGSTADACAQTVRGLVTEVDVMTSAASATASALRGFAEIVRAMRERAEDLRARAHQADAARVEATQRLNHGRAALARLGTEAADHEAAWRLADARADQAVELGSPEAEALRSAAQASLLARNDARAALQRMEAQVLLDAAALAEAVDRLDTIRADARRLAQDVADQAVMTATMVEPVPPFAGGRFRTATAAVAATAAPAVTPAVTLPPARPAGSATSSGRPPTPPAAAAGPPAGRPLAPGPVPVAAAEMVAVASILAAVRAAGGAPVPVAQVSPTLAEFQRFRRTGLQAVTARGAAMARALGFEGTIGGLGSRPTPTDHSKGLAIDLMTYDDIATGEALAAFFREHHEELGVTYIIWNGRICSAREDWAWRPYRHPAGRTDPTAMHLDHVHVSFDPADNAYACACFGVPG